MEGNLMHHGDGYGYHPLFVLEEDFSAGNGDVCNRASIEHKACNTFPFVAKLNDVLKQEESD
jgi:hypothetical protein